MILVSARLRIQALLRRGLSKASVARATGVSLRSVKRIAKEPPLDQTTDADERRRRGIGRPSIVRRFKELVVESLREDPEMTSAAILRRAKARGYPGGKSALYALISTLRPTTVSPREFTHDLPVSQETTDLRSLSVRAGGPSARPDTDGPG